MIKIITNFKDGSGAIVYYTSHIHIGHGGDIGFNSSDDQFVILLPHEYSYIDISYGH